jgi:hypothetical protein
MVGSANIINKQRTADKGWSFSLGVGRGANNCSPQKVACYKTLDGAMNWDLRRDCSGSAHGFLKIKI